MHAPHRSETKAGLTAREQEVARLLARGSSNRDIAQPLSTSERTIEAHLRNMRRKLGLASRSQLIAWAMYNGSGTSER
jgi:DNA-binding NarL/FixJ family response regulator